MPPLLHPCVHVLLPPCMPAPVLLHGASLPLPLPCVTAPFFLSPMIRGLLTEANRLPKTKKPQQGPRPPRPLAPGPAHTHTPRRVTVTHPITESPGHMAR